VIALFSAFCYSFGSLEQLQIMFVSGNSTWCHGEMLWQSYSHVWTIRWWPVVEGASRHSCSKDRSLISPKGYRNDRHLMQVLEVEK